MNNNNQFEKFIRDLNDIRMSNNQKNEMRNNLESFALNYEIKSVQSPYQWTMIFKRPIAIALVILLAMGSTKPASASALPGELLYPVKIIHEEIEAATKTTPEKKASFKIEQTEKRIQEAIKLADSEKLNPETQNQLAANIKTYTEDIAVEIKEIKEEDPQKALELTAELKTTIKSNSGALKKVTSSKKKTQKIKKEVSQKIAKEKENPIEEPTETLMKTSSVSDIPAEDLVEEVALEETNVTHQEALIDSDLITEDDLELIESIQTENIENDVETSIIAEDIVLLDNPTENAVSEEFSEISAQEIPADEVTLDESIELVDIDEESILLDSLELELIFTETIEEEVKEEIIKTLDETTATEDVQTEPEIVADEAPQEESLAEEEFDTAELHTEMIDLAIDGTEPSDNIIITDEIKLESAEEPLETNDATLDELENTTADEPQENIDPVIIPEKSEPSFEAATIPAEERIQNEITALEQVSNLKNRLDLLEIEHDTPRTREESNTLNTELQSFIDKGHYGQAVIYLQSKVDLINESQQVKQIEEDLGIINISKTEEENTPLVASETKEPESDSIYIASE